MLSARERQERSAASLERQFVYRAPWAPRASRASGGGCGFADVGPTIGPFELGLARVTVKLGLNRVILGYYNVGLWTRDYSAKEYNRGKNVVEDIRNYGL
jgi:hypothetical protein